MEKNNFPQVDISDVRRKYTLVDVSKLDFKEPSNSDELQSREFYGDEETIESLKNSILERGLLESPIVMEPDDQEGKYRVLEGNRRCYAVSLLLKENKVSTNNGKALTKIRCELRPNKLTMVEEFFQEWFSLNPGADDSEQEEVRAYILREVMSQLGSDALVRNTQRLNWNAMEQARAIKSLLEAGLSMDQVSKNCSLAENTIKARLSLLNKESEMPEVIEAIDRGEISFHVGKILSNVKDEQTRKEVLKEAINGASGSEVKAKINQKQADGEKEGKTIKAQHRNKKDTATKKESLSSPLGVRKDKDLLEAVSKLSAERTTLSELTDEVSSNSVLDIEIALKVLQWVLNPSDTTEIVTLLLGLNGD
jgi:ParB-like chromosome segregation protein Spo0J